MQKRQLIAIRRKIIARDIFKKHIRCKNRCFTGTFTKKHQVIGQIIKQGNQGCDYNQTNKNRL